MYITRYIESTFGISVFVTVRICLPGCSNTMGSNGQLNRDVKVNLSVVIYNSDFLFPRLFKENASSTLDMLTMHVSLSEGVFIPSEKSFVIWRGLTNETWSINSRPDSDTEDLSSSNNIGRQITSLACAGRGERSLHKTK